MITRRNANKQRQLLRHFDDVASWLTGKSGDVASHCVSRKPRPIAHRTASTKHFVVETLHKLLSHASVSLLRSVTFPSTCRFTFKHSMILTSKAFHTNTYGETVGAYTSTTLSLGHAAPSSSRLDRPILAKGRGDQRWKGAGGEEYDHMTPAKLQWAERAAPQPWLLSAKGRGYHCCTYPLPAQNPPAINPHRRVWRTSVCFRQQNTRPVQLML